MCKIYPLSITKLKVTKRIVIRNVRNNFQNRQLCHDISRPILRKQGRG